MAKTSKGERMATKLREAGLSPWEYSGRGMFGATCIAVSLPHAGDLTTLPRGLPRPSVDSLGKGIVAYWRGYELPPPPPSPTDTLVASVREAMRVYDATGDHSHEGGVRPGDCLRCVLRPFEGK